ncbi:LOW QUALITY PROTEIN: hypothetical protein TMLG_03726, partial [Mycobacterium tuberculosis SUMu012]
RRRGRRRRRQLL